MNKSGEKFLMALVLCIPLFLLIIILFAQPWRGTRDWDWWWFSGSDSSQNQNQGGGGSTGGGNNNNNGTGNNNGGGNNGGDNGTTTPPEDETVPNGTYTLRYVVIEGEHLNEAQYAEHLFQSIPSIFNLVFTEEQLRERSDEVASIVFSQEVRIDDDRFIAHNTLQGDVFSAEHTLSGINVTLSDRQVYINDFMVTSMSGITYHVGTIHLTATIRAPFGLFSMTETLIFRR